MFKWVSLLSLCVCCVFFSGCATKIQAPKMASGEPVTLFFHCDDGIAKEMTADESEQIKEVSNFMKLHFSGLASKSGYKPVLVESKGEFTEGPGNYLVSVKIKKYNAGNKALRIMVGFGAGAVSMDTKYELYSLKEVPLLSLEDGVGSSNPNWIVVPAKLNEKMLAEITKEIQKQI
jgi:hypothetical protein